METCILCKVAAVVSKFFAICVVASCRKVKQRTHLLLRQADGSLVKVLLDVIVMQEATDM